MKQQRVWRKRMLVSREDAKTETPNFTSSPLSSSHKYTECHQVPGSKQNTAAARPTSSPKAHASVSFTTSWKVIECKSPQMPVLQNKTSHLNSENLVYKIRWFSFFIIVIGKHLLSMPLCQEGIKDVLNSPNPQNSAMCLGNMGNIRWKQITVVRGHTHDKWHSWGPDYKLCMRAKRNSNPQVTDVSLRIHRKQMAPSKDLTKRV